MLDKEFSPLRSRASRKPWPKCPDVHVYRCPHCLHVYQKMSYMPPLENLSCCGETVERLQPLQLKDVEPELMINYQIVGGHNYNAIQVFWESQSHKEPPEWVLLKTFTGGYWKYVDETKRSPLVFPLSDEDAYVYCDEEVCLKCVFRCKLGFMIYLYFKDIGFIEVPLDQMKAKY